MKLPYGLGIWLVKHVYKHCQLCHIHFSTNQVGSDPTLQIESSFEKTSNSNNPEILDNGFRYNAYKSANLRLKNKANWLQWFDSGFLCTTCQQSLAQPQEIFFIDVSVFSSIGMRHYSLHITPAAYYRFPIDAVIRRFKLDEDVKQLAVLIHLIQQLPRPQGFHSSNSVIIPMPTTPRRIGERGFDPVMTILPYLSQHWQIPIWQGISRITDISSQRGLSRSERLDNLQSAFRLDQQLPVSKIVLFDDVVTTGASMASLASTVLSSASSITVVSYCLAHA